MTQHMFAVYDSKAQAFTAPFPANTFGIAERMFADLVNTEGHQFNRHPGDYSLHKIGTFESETGELKAVPTEQLASGLHVKHDQESALPWGDA
jgi:hypothetical protein